MSKLQEKLDETVEQYQQNEAEMAQLKQALEERKRLQDQFVGRVSVYRELIDEAPQNEDPQDIEIVEGKAEEVKEDGKGSV